MPSLLLTSSYADVHIIIFPFVALDVEESVKLFPLAVPPITDCPQETPVDKFEVIVLVARVKPVEKVNVDSLAFSCVWIFDVAQSR
jgi:hypothetical protein